MKREDILKAISDSGLPPRLKDYLKVLVRTGTGSELRRDLKADAAGLLDSISTLLHSASAALDAPCDEILCTTGFDYNNFSGDRLEAALAELRAVSILADMGFTGIRLLPGGRSREADISAGLSGKKFAFEVRCVKRASGPSKDLDDRVESLRAVYEKKVRQARVSRRRENSERIGVFIVSAPARAVPMTGGGELSSLAARVYEELGRPAEEHVCLAAGASAAVFPPF
ncbi:MAG TPA: hypothetical protein PK523_10040 [Elusimicrobiales bacterium]|nr:hypothetical protein [Elusimicrobiales bacterium]